MDAGPVQAKAKTLGRRIWRWTLGTLATLIVLLALIIGTVRVMLEQVPAYRDQIQAWVKDTTNLDFRFRTLDARWRIFGPEIYITDAQVFAPDGGPPLAKAKAASIGVDLARVLFRAELLGGRIRLIEPEISLVRTLDGRIELEGQAALDPLDRNRFNVDDLPTGHLNIVDAHVAFRDLKGEFGPLRLDGVGIKLERDRDDLTIEGEAELPEQLGRTLEFLGAAAGRLSEPESLEWSVALDGRALQLAGWREFLGTFIRAPSAGQGDLHLGAALKGMRLETGTLDVRFDNVALAGTDAAQTPARYSRIAGKFKLARVAEALQVAAEGIEFSTDQHRWEPTRATVTWALEGESLARLDVEAGYVRLENLLPIVTIAQNAPWRARALALSPQGEVRDLRFGYVRGAGESREVTASARLRNVGFESVEKAPGLRGLNGEIALAPDSGRLKIDSTGLLFVLPHVFRGPLTADVARGQVGWNRDEAGGWRVVTREFRIRNAHVDTISDAEYRLPADKEQSPVLKLHSRFSDVVLVEGWRYLPVNKLQGKTLEWLDAAFLAGRAPKGEFVFDGPTRKFPFRGGEGEFRITFPVEGLRLHYATDWPDFENLAVNVEFRNQGLTGQVRSGAVNGLKVARGTAQFVDFRTGELTIKAEAIGDIGAALGYLQKSPVGPTLGKSFMTLRGRGASVVTADLMLPVKNIEAKRIDVLARLDGATVTLEESAHVLDHVQGAFRLHDREISMPDGITGTYLGGTIRVDAAPEISSARAENVIRVRAQTPATALADAIAAPDLLGLEGVIDWRGVARFPIQGTGQAATRRAPGVRIDSSLRGTVIGLPAPFGKSAGTSQPLRVDVQWPAASEALVRASYGEEARTQLRLVERGGEWQFTRGVLRFGEGDLNLPAEDGLQIRGSLDALDLSGWLELGRGSAARGGKKGKPLSAYLRSAELAVRELELFGFSFPNVDASLLAGDRAWSVKVDSPRAQGAISVPYDFSAAEPLTLNLAKLSIGDPDTLATPPPERTAGEEKEKDPDPRTWPSVRASISEFEAWGKKLGFLSAELVRVPEGLTLESFAAQSPSFAANGNGSWLVLPEGARGALKFKLEIKNVQQALQDLGYGASLTGARGLMNADLRWVGAPDATLAGRVTGNIHVEMDDGQLLDIKPGAGRVFGLMSVAALPRRLSLDFSDFFGKGLKYDSIRGDFELRAGDAYTNNLLLKGPAAEIGIIGRTGLGKRDYDQTAVVTGSVGNSLPVVGVLAGGPVVGAAVLLFSQVFKEPLKGIARGYYKITGPWESPIVERVGAEAVKKAEGEVRTAEGARDAG